MTADQLDELERLSKEIIEYAEYRKLDSDMVANLPALLSLARDGLRYRWLRDEHSKINPLARVNWKWKMDRRSSEWVNTASCESLDDAIDAAMRGEK